MENNSPLKRNPYLDEAISKIDSLRIAYNGSQILEKKLYDLQMLIFQGIDYSAPNQPAEVASDALPAEEDWDNRWTTQFFRQILVSASKDDNGNFVYVTKSALTKWIETNVIQPLQQQLSLLKTKGEVFGDQQQNNDESFVASHSCTAGNSIDLLAALLSGKQLYKPSEILGSEERLNLWCERDDAGNPHFFQSGWGSAYGLAEKRILEIIKKPSDWRIDFPNVQGSVATDDDSSNAAKPQKWHLVHDYIYNSTSSRVDTVEMTDTIFQLLNLTK